jgi:tRNA (uracil-5-)-methyltransferase TRM9
MDNTDNITSLESSDIKTILDGDIETTHVKSVYESIAVDFNRTRYSHWGKVHEFICEQKSNSKMLDLGCGNGKYLSIRDDLELYALDNCKNLIEIVEKKFPLVKTTLGDVSRTPYPNDFFDSIISIAVIHHLKDESRRLEMLKEIIRILKPGGSVIVSAWATQQTCTNTLEKSKKISDLNDWLIPWEDKKQSKTFQRFYHLFEPTELGDLLGKFSNVHLTNTFYDKDNWYVIFTKKEN